MEATYNPELPEVGEGRPVVEEDSRDPKDIALRVVKADIEVAKTANDSEKDLRQEAYNLYRAMGDGKDDRPGRSRIKSSDVMDMIEWLMPALMKAFFGARKCISVEPIGNEDITKAEKFQKLLNWQFVDKGNGFRTGHEWMKSSLVYGLSPVKVTWQDLYVRKGFAFPEVTEPQFEQLRGDGNVERIEVGSVDIKMDAPQIGQNPYMMMAGQNVTPMMIDPMMLEPHRVYRDVRGEKKIKIYSGPMVEVVPPEDFFCDPEARDIQEARFVIHRVKRTVSYLKKKEQEGIYSNIDDVIESGTVSKGKTDEDDDEAAMRATSSSRYSHYTSRNDVQKARRKIDVWEWWGLLDVDDSGIAEPYLVVIANNVIIRMERNPYAHGEAPFEVMRPILDIFTMKGISMVDLVGEYQKAKTALMRQTLDNISFQNNQMWEVDETAGVDIDSLINPRPGGVVITNRLGAIKQITPAPLEQYAYQTMEFIQGQLEQRTGITRYNQGLSPDTLNKMLALDTPIPMADGTVKLNEDVVAGDMVIGSDGKPTEVLEAHPVQMPKRAFEITFGNGDVIKAGGEHLWTVAIREGKKVFSDFETLPTERIFDILADGKHTAVIPRVKAIEYPEKELTLDPYILGAWLGDGHSHTNRFTSMDEDIADRFRKWAEQFYGGGIEPCKQQRSGRATTYQIVNTPFRQMLKDLNCLIDSRYEDTKNNIKHIPEEYFTASKEQRLELLKGLMDTDGCRYKYKGRATGSSAVFCTSNERLMEDVCRLITSLGGIPKITSRGPVNQDGRKYKRHYHISFSMAECPFSIERKGRDWRAHVNTGRVKILSIKEIEVEPMRCLSVKAEDRMYCCGKYYTVTRNTATGVTAIMGASSQRIELIARVMAETGFRKLYKKMLMLNQQFIDQEIVIRVHGQPLEISPDDLAGNFDVSVDIGGATNKEQQEINQMMTVLNYSQILLQLGVMVPRNVYEIVKKIFETWGVADSEKYITDPQDTEQLRQIIQYIDQLGMMVQNGQPPSIEQLTSGIMAARQILMNVVGKDVSQEQPQPGVSPAGERESAGRSEGDGIAYSSGVIPGGPGGAK